MTKAEEMRAIVDDIRKEKNDNEYQNHLKEIKKRAQEGYSSYTYKDPCAFSQEMRNKFDIDGFTFTCKSNDNDVTITIYW
jgi:hypothetical protein